MAPLPTIVLVHGTWHSVECWDRVTSRLEAVGYPCIAVPLKTVGDEAATSTLIDDSILTHDIVEALANEGKDVVLVTHSYGGVVGGNATQGLVKTLRAKEGKPGGVICLAMLCAFLRPEGYSPHGFLANAKVDWWVAEGDLFFVTDGPKAFYNDLDPEDAKYWVSKLRPSRFAEKVETTYAGWRDLPVFYLMCEQDNAIPFMYQEMMLEEVKKEGVDLKYARCNASHSPMLSMPDYTAKFIREAAGEKVFGEQLMQL